MISVRVLHDDPFTRAQVRALVHWFFDRAMPLDRDIHVRIRFDDRLDADGSATWNRSPAARHTSTRARSFTVVLHGRLCCDELLSTLLHELVHVHQFATRTLVFSERGDTGVFTYWKGQDRTEDTYSRQPWERQAYRAEARLHALVLDECPALSEIVTCRGHRR